MGGSPGDVSEEPVTQENELCRRWNDGNVGEWTLHLRHSSFSNPSFALPTSQLIFQPFRCFTYITVHPPTLLSLFLRHRLFTYVTWRVAHNLKIRNSGRRRGWWVHQLNEWRIQQGEYLNLLREMTDNDRQEFLFHNRLNPDQIEIIMTTKFILIFLGLLAACRNSPRDYVLALCNRAFFPKYINATWKFGFCKLSR